MSLNVVTRFPPSPTGHLHIGGVRTALFNYLFAKHNKGAMFLRFEDTDKERSKKEFEEDILEALTWLGLTYTLPEWFRQSERTSIYQKYLMQLIEKGSAYEAEAGKDDPTKKIVRFRNPNVKIVFSDLVRGEVSFDTKELGDFVIAKSVTLPLYHLAVVIDDHEMNVSHVIRGEDHISNTPRQILMLEALGFSRPLYAHIPLILAPDRSKMSKRHGAVAVTDYRTEGFLPQALLNYLALLGWNPGGERELYSLPELVEVFSIEHIHKGGAIFDIEKLKWFNHEYIKKLADEEFLKILTTFAGTPISKELVPLLKERARTLKEATDAITKGEYAFMDTEISFEHTLLTKSAKADSETVKKHLQKITEFLAPLSDEDFTAGAVKEAVFAYATEVGRSAVLWPMRVALSGRETSPDPFTLAGLLGKEKTLSRIEKAAQML